MNLMNPGDLGAADRPHDGLERDLAALTAPAAPPREAWKAALGASRFARLSPVAADGTNDPAGRTHRRRSLLRLRPALSIAACLSFGAVVVSLAWLSSGPRAGVAWSAASTPPPLASVPERVLVQSHDAADLDGYRLILSPTDVPQIDLDGVLAQGTVNSVASPFQEDRKVALLGDIPVVGGLFDKSPALQSPGESSPADRHVVRKAFIELLAKDVRTAFQQSTLLVSEARSEFFTDATITGEKDAARASLTLRITPDRLAAVLQALRELGKVNTESLAGEDVTERLTDVEARIRNEQRVEAELLELLASRKDAPLKEILELRQNIASVRENVERLKAQQANIGRLVSLATILVVIRADVPAPVAPEPEPEKGVLGIFGDRIAAGWTSGLFSLAAFAGDTVRFLIAGLPWWILLAAVFAAASAARRALKRRAAAEPAPAC